MINNEISHSSWKKLKEELDKRRSDILDSSGAVADAAVICVVAVAASLPSDHALYRTLDTKLTRFAQSGTFDVFGRPW